MKSAYRKPFGPLGFLFCLVIALVVLVIFWDWNWFRAPLEERVSAKLGRQVRIRNLKVILGEDSTVLLDGLSLANPTDFPKDSKTATIQRLGISLRLRELLHHHVLLTHIDIDHPKVDLGRGAQGNPNWKLAIQSSPSSEPSWKVDLLSLSVEAGMVHFVDPRLKADFGLDIHTQAAAGQAELATVVQIAGRYAGQPISGRFIGGSVLTLRDRARPYPVDLKLANGPSHISLTGTLLDPQHLAGADLTLLLTGEDLADLYPLTGIPLAQTPPYQLKGQLDYAAHKVRFRNFSGTVGQSDLSGDVTVDPGHERPQVIANVRSKRVVLADLGGFIGAAPGKADAPTEGAKQKLEHEQGAASSRLLPDRRINLPKLRSADVELHYRGDHIEGTSAPLDNFVANLSIVNGAMRLHPLSFGVGQGSILINLQLNGQQDLVHMIADVDFRRVDLRRVMQSTKLFEGAGTIGGAARIDTVGNSVAQMAAQGNGEIKLFMQGGNLSALLVDLAGLDFGNGVLSALGLPSRADLRCVVSDFDLQSGILHTKAMLFDTTEANVLGKGDVDLRQETIDYRLSTEPKHFSIGSLHAPINITGPLKKPSVKPDMVSLGARGAAAAILGITLTPVAALLPTIQLGLGENHDCAEMLSSVETDAARIQAQQGHDQKHAPSPASSTGRRH